jgi:hypothetical protein
MIRNIIFACFLCYQPAWGKEVKNNVSYMNVIISYKAYFAASEAFQAKDTKKATLKIDQAIRINPESPFLHKSALQFKKFTSYTGEYLNHYEEIYRLYRLKSPLNENTAQYAASLSFIHLQINSHSLYQTFAMEAISSYEALQKYELAASEAFKFAQRQKTLKNNNSAEIYFADSTPK